MRKAAMQKITWREPMIGEDGADMATTYHGKNLGPVVKAGKTFLVVYCDDGHVREVPIDDIIPY